MNGARIVTGFLLIFVGASLAYFVIKDVFGPKEPIQAVDVKHLAQALVSTNDVEAGVSQTRHVIAYYFHGNVRCGTCKKLEAYTKETIHQDFADALKSGLLTWRLVNVDESANAHFIKDYSLTTRAVVLVDMVNDKPKQWQKLAKIWDLVGDKEAFQKYIATTTTEFLENETE